MKYTKMFFVLVLGLTVLAFTGIEKEKTQSEQTIVELASSNDNLTTLVSALKAADLTETLNAEGPYTVFAPTNEAFEALPEGTLEALMKPENKEKLVSILEYHVLRGEIESTELKDGQEVATLEGSKIEVSTSGATTVDEATVQNADMQASNGVVHVIDEVIMPDMKPKKNMDSKNNE